VILKCIEFPFNFKEHKYKFFLSRREQKFYYKKFFWELPQSYKNFISEIFLKKLLRGSSLRFPDPLIFSTLSLIESGKPFSSSRFLTSTKFFAIYFTTAVSRSLALCSTASFARSKIFSTVRLFTKHFSASIFSFGNEYLFVTLRSSIAIPFFKFTISLQYNHSNKAICNIYKNSTKTFITIKCCWW